MLRKISYIVLAIFLLVSTIGITISMHYCGGKFVSLSITTQAKSCCDTDCGCCENKTLHFENQDDYVSPIIVQANTIVELDVLFPILFVINTELIPTEDKTKVVFHDSSPPPKIQARLSLLQTYLC